MNITSDTIIAGHSATHIRTLFRKGEKGVSLGLTASVLHITNSEAQKVIAELQSLGYITDGDPYKEIVFYALTDMGHSLRNASAAKPIHRKTANRLLQQFLERVREVNTNEYYLYRVQDVQVFGSYLSDKPRISDIDLAINVQSKFEGQQRLQVEKERSRLAEERGKHFNTYYDYRAYPRSEVYIFLRNKSRSLALHNIDEPQELGASTKVLYTYP